MVLKDLIIRCLTKYLLKIQDLPVARNFFVSENMQICRPFYQIFSRISDISNFCISFKTVGFNKFELACSEKGTTFTITFWTMRFQGLPIKLQYRYKSNFTWLLVYLRLASSMSMG